MAVDVMHPGLRIPAFYTLIPGAHFRERAAGDECRHVLPPSSSARTQESPDGPWPGWRRWIASCPGKYYVRFYLGTCHLSLPPARTGHGIPGERPSPVGPKEEDIPSIYVYMGVCLKELETITPRPWQWLEKAERYDPERTDVHNLMGFCCFKLKEHERAIEHFRKRSSS